MQDAERHLAWHAQQADMPAGPDAKMVAVLLVARADVADLIAVSESYRQIMRVAPWSKESLQVWQEHYGLPVYAKPAEIKQRAHVDLMLALARVKGEA